MTTQTKNKVLSEKDGKRIIEAACNKWKKTLSEEWGADFLIKGHTEISEQRYKQYRAVCTPDQHKLFDDIFGVDVPFSVGDWVTITERPLSWSGHLNYICGLNKVKYPYTMQITDLIRVNNYYSFADGVYGWSFHEGYPIRLATTSEILNSISEDEVYYLETKSKSSCLFLGGNPTNKRVRGINLTANNELFEDLICYERFIKTLRKATEEEKEIYYKHYPKNNCPYKKGDLIFVRNGGGEYWDLRYFESMNGDGVNAYRFQKMEGITTPWKYHAPTPKGFELPKE